MFNKKSNIYSLIIIMVFFALFSYSCVKNNVSLKEFSIEKTFLPVFVLSEIDYKNKNQIIGLSLFIKNESTDEKLIEYTILFNDEDYPNFFINFIYDIFRSFKYKRIIDTESFFINYIKVSDDIWKVDFVDFPDDYSSDQTFFEKKVKHYPAKIEGSAFEKINDRTVIYVNTWNHMFSNVDNNKSLAKKIIESYKIYFGSRSDVEKQFNNK